MEQIRLWLAVFLLISASVVSVTEVSSKSLPHEEIGGSPEFTLTVLHTNDIHGRFMETNQNSLECSAVEEADEKCYGGYARMFTKV